MWVASAAILASAAAQAADPSAVDRRFEALASGVRVALTAGDARRAEDLARQLAGTVASSDAPAHEVAAAQGLLGEALLLAGKATGPEALAAVEGGLRAVPDDTPAARLERARLQSLAGRLLTDRGENDAARERFEAALTARTADLSSCAPDRLASLQELAPVLLETGRADTARTLASEARTCEATAVLPLLTRARTRELDARVARYEGHYEYGLRLAEEARGLRESTEPLDVPGWIGTLNLIGELDWFLGRFDAARQRHEQALVRAREVFGETHPVVGTTVSNLGHVERSVGNATDALRLQQQALGIARATRGETHFETLYALQNLANLHQEQEEYPQALELYEKVLESTMRSFGPESDDAATVLYNLGVLRNRMGEPDRARADLEQALRIWEKWRGSAHAYLARPLDVLAEVFVQQGAFGEAEARLERSSSIRREAQQAQPEQLAWTLARLGAVRWRLGKAESARRLADEASALCARASGSDEARIATLGRIGELEIELGRFGNAAARLEDALALAEKRLGGRHPSTARLRASLASTLLRTGRIDAAFTQGAAAEATRRLLLRQTLRYLAEGQALRFAARPPAARDVLLSIAARDGTASHATAAFEAVTQSRALVLDEMASRRQVRTTEPGSLDARIEAARQRLANLLYRESDRALEGGAGLLVQASDDLEKLEREAATRTASQRERVESPSPDLPSLVAALPEATGLVSFVRFRRSGGSPSDDQYLAFVLRGDRPIPLPETLGAAAAIDSAVERWREVVSSTAAFEGRFADWERESRKSGREVAALVWRPVAPHLRGLRRVLIVPDGALGLVSFAALPADGASYLVEDGPTLHSLSSERDLLRAAAEGGPACPLLAVGGPDYDAPREGEAERATVSPRAGDPRPARFAFLPHAAAEAKEVTDLWRGQGACGSSALLVGREAREDALRRLTAGKAVLHLATHGFFARSSPAAPGAGERGKAVETTAAVLLRNPLLESGLAFAGANRLDDASDPADDGLLTAAEVASLDLRSARYVVLSACGSGIGHVQAGEGVMSLQRAFALAGAGSVVMTLWSVDDREARRWMRAFYQARLAPGASTADAVRAAQRQALARLRTGHQGAPPALWAAFVATGDWR